MNEDHALRDRQVQHRDRRAHQDLATARRSPTAPSRSSSPRRRSRRSTPSGAASSSRRFRASTAGATTPRRSSSRTRSPRAATIAYVLPHTRQAILDALRRAGIDGRAGTCDGDRDARLLHDLRVHGDRSLRPHRARRVLEGGRGGRDRDRRQAADQSERRPDRRRPPGRRHRRAPAARRLRSRSPARAGDYQVEDAERFATLNIGGSGTTSCVFIVGN